ncbi:MAG TPA: isopentenyl-diphosphate Delta-isomerase [Acidimicrobiales bacterium]|nr:isopentenyl-diphosphate Delta-isomerase [Acidimicrobiales bacterium]
MTAAGGVTAAAGGAPAGGGVTPAGDVLARVGSGIDATQVPVATARVVLVDVEGNVTGEADKLDAHKPPGTLHLAFSVFLYRADGRLLLQQRAASKYHFPLVWANACCSHPEPGEELLAAAQERVGEELGIAVELADVGSIVYRAVCPTTGLVEHELDHILLGETSAEPHPDPSEVADHGWYLPGEVLSPRCALRRAPWLTPGLLLAERRRAAARRG